MATIYVSKPKGDSTRRYNTTGTAFVVNEFVVLAGMCLRALEAVANAALGAFEKLKGEIIQISSFNTSEDAFASANLAVYWDSSSGKFSNTKKVGFYLIGYTMAAAASGVIDVEVVDPVLVPTLAGLADVSLSSPTNGQALKYETASTLWKNAADAT